MSILVTTRQAAERANVKPATVRTWVSRGLLVPIDRDAQGFPLYLLASVLRCERNNRERIAATRRSGP